MSRRIADLLIKIGADSYEFHQKAQQVEKGLGGLSKKLTDVGKNLSMQLTAPLAVFGTMAVSAADGALKAIAKVEQGVKSTGGSAGFTANALVAISDELERLTLFDGDDILNGATTQLLTFTNIFGENFKRTQVVAMDLATVLQGDLKSASIQLGKALNDPVKNLSALSRSGIQFSKEQTAVIKSLSETGRLAEAQSLILDELERQYGGQAEAAAKVGAYSLNELQDAWGKLMDEFGMVIIPMLNKVVDVIVDMVTWLQTLSPTTLKVVTGVAALAAALGPLLLTLGSVIKALPLIKVGLLALSGPMTGLIGLAAMLAVGLSSAISSYQQLQNVNTDIAVRWVAEGSYNVGDENKVKDAIAGFEKELQKLESNYEKLGFWKNLNSDYRNDTNQLNNTIDLYKRVLIELAKKKKLEDASAVATKKTMADAKRQAEELAKAVVNGNNEIKQSGNIITTLNNKIDALEKKKLLPSSTIQDIANINAEVVKLQKELKRLQSITPDQLNRKSYTPISLPNTAPIVPQVDVKLPDFQMLISKAQQQMLAINDIVANGIYGWADKTATAMANNVAKTSDIISNYTDALVDKGWNFSDALEYVSSNVADAMSGFDNSVKQFLASSITGAAEAFGQVLAGDLGLDGLLSSILSQFASFMKQIGSQLISFGIMIVAFKASLASILANPWGAIAIGTAMVIAASAMTALINKNAGSSVPKLAKGGLAYGATYAMVGDNPNARVDPEVIAPLSKLKQMIQPRNNAIGGQVEFVIEGRVLKGILTKMNKIGGRTNG